MNRRLNSLSRRLLLSLGVIIFITQTLTIAWLLHEDRELLATTLRNIGQPESTIHQLHGTNKEMLSALLVPTAIEFLMSLAAAAFMISWIVAPLKRLTNQLQQRTVEQWQPFDADSNSKEVIAITGALNGLMLKLQQAFQRERQFTADVSHELRTPIAGIRLNLELLALQHPEEIKPLIARLDSMQHTIEQLLTMARMEQQMVMGLQTQVDLVQDVVLPLKNELAEMLRSQEQTLQIDCPSSLTVEGDATLLRMLLRNLIGNSNRYADQNSVVTITVEMVNDQPALMVTDMGAGVEDSKIAALTDAFQRFDQRGNGIGLGLNIVARVCALHRANLHIENHHAPKGLRVEIIFPNEDKKG
ncbi:two-component system sensor histidine kinase PmrB [Tolumonas lignilytica]|uniref:two-component system sensor histidine kinase PmrB n=1 Tax=Tolumonas lignilytica TaxID=1283284 RepID=UPI0004B22B38|nr:two-component system sensor histidine kinase PmrB [Tolumonas lignilytica]